MRDLKWKKGWKHRVVGRVCLGMWCGLLEGVFVHGGVFLRGWHCGMDKSEAQRVKRGGAKEGEKKLFLL